MLRAFTLACTLFAVAGEARAADPMRPWLGELAWEGQGDRWSGNKGWATLGARLFLAGVFTPERPDEGWTRLIALGLTGYRGKVFNDLTNDGEDEPSVKRWLFGPELRVGLIRGGGDRPKIVYLAFSPFYVWSPLDRMRVPESQSHRGLRAGAGLSYPRSWPVFDYCHNAESRGGRCTWGLLLILLPNSIHLGYERIGSSGRLGGHLGWAF